MESLQQAVDLAGGQAQLARGIRERISGSKISQPHVYKWLNSPNPDQMPPADVVLAIADFLDYRMTPHELRPDLYPNSWDGLPIRFATPIIESRMPALMTRAAPAVEQSE